jgi:hypothetical protein
MATVREFNGERFYLKKTGHYRNPNGDLHRRIWEADRGPIPDGMIIHHIDEDPSNNSLENLMLMEHAEHSRHHARQISREELLARVARARRLGNIKDVPAICEECGADMFAARKAAKRNDERRKRFCSRECCSRADYKRRKAELAA